MEKRGPQVVSVVTCVGCGAQVGCVADEASYGGWKHVDAAGTEHKCKATPATTQEPPTDAERASWHQDGRQQAYE